MKLKVILQPVHNTCKTLLETFWQMHSQRFVEAKWSRILAAIVTKKVHEYVNRGTLNQINMT